MLFSSCVFMWSSLHCVCGRISSSYKDTGLIGSGPTLTPSFQLHHPFKDLVSKSGHFLQFQRLGLPCTFLRNRIQPITNDFYDGSPLKLFISYFLRPPFLSELRPKDIILKSKKPKTKNFRLSAEIYIYIYTHTHTHVYIYTHTCGYSLMHSLMHAHTHTHTHTHIIWRALSEAVLGLEAGS